MFKPDSELPTLVNFLANLTVVLGFAATVLSLVWHGISTLRAKKTGKETAEQIVQKRTTTGKISGDDSKILLNTLKFRQYMNIGFGIAFVILVSVFAYFQSLQNPSRELPAKLEWDTVQAVAVQKDKWVQVNPLLFNVIHSLTEDARAREKAGKIKDYQIVRGYTEEFGKKTSGHPTSTFLCTVKYSPTKYRLSAYAMRVTGKGQQEVMQSLTVKTSEGALRISVPESSPSDRLLVVGSIAQLTDDPIPEDFKSVLSLEVTKSE